MNKIPEDVIAAGNRFQDLFGDGRQGYVAFDIAVLAIMAERERCLKIAEDVYNDSYTYNGAHDGVEAVISAIRQGQAKEGESA